MAADTHPQSPPDRQGLDEGVLARLLVLAGPQDAQELMRRLVSDLAAVQVGLTHGLDRDDRAAVRQHSHVLMAIAGTLGAEGLHRQAREINAEAKGGGTPPDALLALDLLRGLDRLLLRLRAIAHDRGWGG